MKVLNIASIATAVALLFLVSGCSSGPKPLYNYEEYSQSYYDLKKEPNEESALAYQRALEEVIANKGESSSGRVPPGMYANLGYLYLKTGNTQKALESFTQEKSIYPEAAFFMDRMINRIGAMEGNDEK